MVTPPSRFCTKRQLVPGADSYPPGKPSSKEFGCPGGNPSATSRTIEMIASTISPRMPSVELVRAKCGSPRDRMPTKLFEGPSKETYPSERVRQVDLAFQKVDSFGGLGARKVGVEKLLLGKRTLKATLRHAGDQPK
jgi:hypothetical protein